MADVSVPMGDIAKSLTITVRLRGLSLWKGKFWLSLQLIKLAVWVSGFNIVVE